MAGIGIPAGIQSRLDQLGTKLQKTAAQGVQRRRDQRMHSCETTCRGSQDNTEQTQEPDCALGITLHTGLAGRLAWLHCHWLHWHSLHMRQQQCQFGSIEHPHDTVALPQLQPSTNM